MLSSIQKFLSAHFSTQLQIDEKLWQLNAPKRGGINAFLSQFVNSDTEKMYLGDTDHVIINVTVANRADDAFGAYLYAHIPSDFKFHSYKTIMSVCLHTHFWEHKKFQNVLWWCNLLYCLTENIHHRIKIFRHCNETKNLCGYCYEKVMMCH